MFLVADKEFLSVLYEAMRVFRLSYEVTDPAESEL